MNFFSLSLFQLNTYVKSVLFLVFEKCRVIFNKDMIRLNISDILDSWLTIFMNIKFDFILYFFYIFKQIIVKKELYLKFKSLT